MSESLSLPVMNMSFSPVAASTSVYQSDHPQLSEVLMSNLQDMADNSDLLEWVRDRRFNRDGPPSYRSLSPDGDGGSGNPRRWAMSAADKIIAEIDELVRRPLNEQELRETQQHFETWHPAYHPGRRYDLEASQDAALDAKGDPGPSETEGRAIAAAAAVGRAEKLRQRVLIRHRIKQRWQKLGVWNPEWGIPGRVDEGPQDQTATWKWRWQGDTPDRGYGSMWKPYLPQHPNSRAVRLRLALRPGERGPLPPRHSLAADATKGTAEFFITSRPWYVLGLDEEEERTRLNRIPYSREGYYDLNQAAHVAARWEARGDCTPHAARARWKWRHESPSPEPEGLESIEFTPSEIDALEAIPPSTPPSPSLPS